MVTGGTGQPQATPRVRPCPGNLTWQPRTVRVRLPSRRAGLVSGEAWTGAARTGPGLEGIIGQGPRPLLAPALPPSQGVSSPGSRDGCPSCDLGSIYDAGRRRRMSRRGRAQGGKVQVPPEVPSRCLLTSLWPTVPHVATLTQKRAWAVAALHDLGAPL